MEIIFKKNILLSENTLDRRFIFCLRKTKFENRVFLILEIVLKLCFNNDNIKL